MGEKIMRSTWRTFPARQACASPQRSQITAMATGFPSRGVITCGTGLFWPLVAGFENEVAGFQLALLHSQSK